MPQRPPTHQGHKTHRRTARERGYNARWEKASKAFLRINYLCRACCRLGRVRQATCVDHVIPHRGDEGLFWDEGNWQSLCKDCHDAKTARGE